MKIFIILSVVLAVAFARPQGYIVGQSGESNSVASDTHTSVQTNSNRYGSVNAGGVGNVYPVPYGANPLVNAASAGQALTDGALGTVGAGVRGAVGAGAGVAAGVVGAATGVAAGVAGAGAGVLSGVGGALAGAGSTALATGGVLAGGVLGLGD